MAAFATTDDVAARLLRPLSDEETAGAELAIELVSGLIVDALGRDSDSAEQEIDPVPSYFRTLCIEKAVGLIANPRNLASTSETLGSFSRSETYPRALDAGLVLTPEEECEVKAVFYGHSTVSTRIESGLDFLTEGPATPELPI